MSVLSRGRRGRFILVAAVMGMLVALGLSVPTTDAQGQSSEPGLVDAGIILLSTGPNASNNWIRYYENPVAPLDVTDWDAHQGLMINNKCGVTSDNSILVLSQTGGNRIAMVSNGLGVSNKNNCSTAQGRVGDTQELKFTLADSFADNVFVELVEVDAEGKFGTDLGWSVSDGTSTESGMSDLVQSSDNGPDSGTNDNEIAEVDPTLLFRDIAFAPTGSEVAIEGGGDGIIPGGTERTVFGVNQTLFKLVEVFDGELNCNDPAVGHSGPGPEDGPATEITLWRGDNKGPTCDLIPYTFRNEGGAQSEGGVVKFDAAFLQQPDATFLVKIEWDPSDPIVDPFNPPDREIDLLLGDGFQRVEACESLVSEGTLDDPDPDIDDVYQHPEGEPWCLAGERLVLGTDGLWTQIQWYDGGEDPNWR